MSPEEILSAGQPYLDAVLVPAGFALELKWADQGSGGRFVQAAYVRGTRRLEFSVRQTLGLVAYVDGVSRLPHEDYIRAVTAGQQKGQYPGFGADAVDAFRDLAIDLKRFGAAFLDPSPARLAVLCAWTDVHPRPSGLEAIQ